MQIEGVRIFDVALVRDKRGTFLKPVERRFVDTHADFGEIYVIHAAPGAVRGNHHHKTSAEWFCVIAGRGLLVLEKNSIREEVHLDGERPKTVKIPANVAHAIKNVGKSEMTLLVYWDRAYDPSDTDTYPESIQL